MSFEQQVAGFIEKLAGGEMQPHQKRVVDKLMNSNHGIVAMHGVGSGKALPLDSQILTPDGWINNGDLQVGDLVIAGDGTPTQVLGVYSQGVRPCYKLTFSDGVSTIADEEHLWETTTQLERHRVAKLSKNPNRKNYTRCTTSHSGIRTTKEIYESVTWKQYRYNHAIPMVGPVDFTSKNLPIDPYFLGILLGDGCFCGSSITLTTMDIEIENYVRCVVARDFDSIRVSSVIDKRENKAWNLGFSTIGKKPLRLNTKGYLIPGPNAIMSQLHVLGLKGKKAWDKFIPDTYLFASVADRVAMLQGLLDTDGFCSKKGTTVDYCTTSPHLANGVAFLVQSLGGMVTINEKIKKYTYKGVKKQGRLAYNVYIKLPGNITPFKISRKVSRYIPKTKYTPRRYVAAVEKVEARETSCISVAHPSQLYVINDFIVTHNTRLSIEAAKALKIPTIVAPPAALQENYRKELKRWDVDGTIKDIKIQSQQGAATKGLHPHGKDSLVVVDEAHKSRDPNGTLHKVLAKSPSKKLLMTGSGVYNHPVDLANLVNLAANKKVLPSNREEFEKRFVGYDKVKPSFLQGLAGLHEGERPTLKDSPELKSALKKYVDYHTSGSDNADFPSVKEVDKIVPMSRGQTDIYNTIMGKAPMWTRMKVKAGLPPNRKELAKLKAFLTGPRQVSNSSTGFTAATTGDASKVEAAFKSLQDHIKANPKHKAVVYSNFIDSGLGDYKKHLDTHGIPYGEFSGEISDKQRQQHVKDFNDDKLKALLISSAGAEGLDLKGTRQVQLLEPHFNEEKERQIIGRARRYKSHEHLPENERNVTVERYLARPQGGFMDRIMGGGSVHGVDEYIRDIAKSKSSLNDQMIEILKNQQKKNFLGL